MKKAAMLALALLSSLAQSKPVKSEWDGAETRKGLDALARCVVRVDPDAARKYVMSRRLWPGGPGDVLDHCLGVTQGTGKLRFPEFVVRYVLADALVRRDYAAGMPDVVNHKIPIYEKPAPTAEELKLRADPRKAADFAIADARSASTDHLRQVAECVVIADPRATYDVLLTAPASPEEVAKLQPVVAALPACVDPTEQLSIDKISLRGSLAVAFFRLAQTPVGQSR